MKALYPGSFDPITLGHFDIITRAANITEELIVAVLNNSAKSPLFSVGERVEILTQTLAHLPNVRIESFSGLLVDFAKQMGANTIIRGLRAITDFEMEMQMAQTNKMLNPAVETLFIATGTQFSYLSSSIVKEVAHHGGNIDSMVHEVVKTRLQEKIGKGGK